MNDKWKGYRRAISEKRSGGAETKNTKKVSTLIVQKMYPAPVGKLNKYEPMLPRDFIDFAQYSKLTLVNVKDACEKFYAEVKGSSDILYEVTGPSCTTDEQLSGMKFFRVRFPVPKSEISNEPKSKYTSSKKESENEKSDIFSVPVKSKRKRTSVFVSKQPCTQNSMPLSISIGGLLQAGKLVTPTQEKEITLTLESFNIKNQIWLKQKASTFCIQSQKFAEGGFRNAFKAYTTEEGDKTKMWVIKKFKEAAWKVCGPKYEMSLEQHTRKQVQMHTAAKAITAQCTKKTVFRENWFQFTIYFTILDDEPVTVEPFVNGAFVKYLNNDGQPCKRKNCENLMYEKAEALTHFSYQERCEKLLLVDLQGSGYNLYDPEIATSDELQESETSERYFCAGNLNEVAFTNFF